MKRNQRFALSRKIEQWEVLHRFLLRCNEDKTVTILDVENTLSIVKFIAIDKNLNERDLHILRLTAQCLAILSNKSHLIPELWNWCQPLLQSWLNLRDEKFIDYFALYLKNIFSHSVKLCSYFVKYHRTVHYIPVICNAAIKNGKNSQALLGTLIQQGHFRILYNVSNAEQRIFLLSILEQNIQSKKYNLQDDDVTYILFHLKSLANYILNPKEKSHHVELGSILTLLLYALNSHKEIICNDLFFANDIFTLLKASQNAPLQDFTNEFVPSFKKNYELMDIQKKLLQIIIHLSHKNKKIQHLARETDAIKVIFELISDLYEFSMISLQTLIEDNEENKQYVSKIMNS